MPGTTLRTPLSPRATGDISILEAQRIKKIRVNRVSLIQELRVEYVLQPLVDRGVLTESERDFIEQGVSVQDKTRRLVDLIPTKGKSIDWYHIFREVLCQPDGDDEVRECCQRIVSYLDNTIISRPQDIARSGVVSPVSQTDKEVKQMTFPKYQPLPDISKSNTSKQSVVRFNLDIDTKRERLGLDAKLEETESEDMFSDVDEIDIGLSQSLQPRRLWRNMTVDSYFRKPLDLFDVLQKGESDGDLQQLTAEENVWSNVQHLEVPLDLFHKKSLLGPFDFLLCKELYSILTDSNNHHLYLKYFNQLKYEKYFDVLKELEKMFVDLFDNIKSPDHKEARDLVVDIGFGLTSLLLQYSYFFQAEKVMSALVQYLSSSGNKDCWLQQFHAYLKLFEVRLVCLDLTLADHSFFAAQTIAEKIQNDSEDGNAGLNCAELYTLTSQLMRQRGSLVPALTWSQKALQEAEQCDASLRVDVMCEAVKAYCATWNIKEAEDIVIEAIKQAKKYFGTNHPLYLKALLHYCHYSSLFRKNTLGVNVAMHALDIAQKLYGMTGKDQDVDLINSTLPLAHSHRELAKAIGLCKTGVVNPDLGFKHANQAYRMALDILPGLHPQLSKFRYSLACCVLWKDSSMTAETKEDLDWAKSKVKESLSDGREMYGNLSLKVAKLHSLLGQIYVKMERFEDAEMELNTSLEILKNCMPHDSSHIFVAQGALATLYMCTSRPTEAIQLFTEVVENSDTKGVYVEWVDSSYSSLVSLLNATNEVQLAEYYKAKHEDWLNENKKLPDADFWTRLEEPPMGYDAFLSQLHLLTKRQRSSSSGFYLADIEG